MVMDDIHLLDEFALLKMRWAHGRGTRTLRLLHRTRVWGAGACVVKVSQGF